MTVADLTKMQEGFIPSLSDPQRMALAAVNMSQVIRTGGEPVKTPTASSEVRMLVFDSQTGYDLQHRGFLTGDQRVANRRPTKMGYRFDGSTAQGLESLLSEGDVWKSMPDKDVWNLVLAYARETPDSSPRPRFSSASAWPSVAPTGLA